MTDPDDTVAPPGRRRPAVLTIAMVLVYLSGFLSTGLGVLVLLSRYDVPAAEVLPVSLLGAGIILFGLLTLAVASGIGRGSRLSRGLVTVYAALELTLHVITIITSDTFDLTSAVDAVLDLFVLVAMWTPPGSRLFRRGVAAT